MPTSGCVSSIWLIPDDVSDTALPRGCSDVTSKMQPTWMSPERNIRLRPGRGVRLVQARREGLVQQVLLLAAGEAVRPLVARLVEVGDLEVAEVELACR